MTRYKRWCPVKAGGEVESDNLGKKWKQKKENFKMKTTLKRKHETKTKSPKKAY